MRIRRLAAVGLLGLSVRCFAAAEPFQKLLERQRLKMKDISREPRARNEPKTMEKKTKKKDRGVFIVFKAIYFSFKAFEASRAWREAHPLGLVGLPHAAAGRQRPLQDLFGALGGAKALRQQRERGGAVSRPSFWASRGPLGAVWLLVLEGR